MGFRRSAKEAYLEVSLDHNVRYTIRSHICGTIRLLNCPAEDNRGVMVVTLSGVSKTQITDGSGDNTVTYRSRAPLLNLHQPLVNPRLEQDGTTTWRFDILVPDNCGLRGVPPVYEANGSRPAQSHFHTHWEPDRPYTCSTSQAPPPSFGPDAVPRNLDHIAYHIIAELHVMRDPGFIHAIREVQITRGPPATPKPPANIFNDLVIRSPLLRPENSDRSKLTLREKTSALLSSSKLPTFSFRYTTLVPSQIAIGAPLQLHLSLQPNPGPDDAPVPKLVSVEMCQIKVRRHLYWRSHRKPAYATMSTNSTRYFEHKLQKCGSLQADSDWDTSVISPPVQLPGPSFSTYNIARFYDIEVEWVLRCAGEKHRIKCASLSIDVHEKLSTVTSASSLEAGATPASYRQDTGPSVAHAAEPRPEVEATWQYVGNAHVTGDPADAAVLPAYQDDAGPSSAVHVGPPAYEISQYINRATEKH